MTFELFRDASRQWRWRLVGGNGEIVAQGEGYASKSNARRAIKRMKSETWHAETREFAVEL